MKDYIDSGIIDAVALKKALKAGDNIRLLDGSYVLPGSTIDPQKDFKNKHIGGAQFFDIDSICDQDSDLPHMLPSSDHFAAAVGALGISNDSIVVVYGQSGMIMGPARVWWSFRAFGHDRVCVLDGGLPAWESAGFEICADKPKCPSPQHFDAKLKSALVKSLDEMLGHVICEECCVIDARPSDRFSGAVPDPRAALRAGHMPNSVTVPASSLVNADGTFCSESEILRLFQDAKVNLNRNLITTCGSGVTACLLSLALFYVGYKDSAVYDGSWAEWGKNTLSTTVIGE